MTKPLLKCEHPDCEFSTRSEYVFGCHIIKHADNAETYKWVPVGDKYVI